ncbi:MAG: acetate/propionate family kinase [Candidatus Zhuqueibacterota bacterium]
MKILVLNCGSSSVKYQLINGSNKQWLVRGNISRIGASDADVSETRSNGSQVKYTKNIQDHDQAIQQILDNLLSKHLGIIKDVAEIFAVGHRVVHGGETFSQPTLITDAVIRQIEACSSFAPLHNPSQLKGILACKKLLPGVPEVAVFDTAFHQTMPGYSYLYGLPYEFYKKYGIRRYGFHGTSHYYVAHRVAELAGIPIEKLKIITCHLGNGSSIAAVNHGKVLDTSMGFTPLEGLLMGTRTGDIDCSAVLYLMKQEQLTIDQVDSLLNTQSGVKGISGNSNDMRKIIEAASHGDERSQLAFDVFCYRIKKYIGAYAAAMGGVDMIVFTAGIGENASLVRAKACSGLDFLGVELDQLENSQTAGVEKRISKEHSRVQVWVVPTNEELVIAEHTLTVVYAGH